MKSIELMAEELGKPLNAKHVAARTQSGRNLSYIESHTAIREANRIFGFDGWSRETTEMRVVQAEEKPSKNGGSLWWVGYTCKVIVKAMGTQREGTGFGQGQDADLGRAHESAIKEAESDAMKRALMTFGDPFGLALYDKTQEHVEKAPSTARSAQPAASSARPATWTSRDLSDALGKFDLKMADLEPVLGEAVTTQNYAGLLNDYFAKNPTENVGTLAIRASAKAGKALPKVTPEDLSPRADVRQGQMAVAN